MSIQPRFEISNNDWNDLKQFINSYYPKDSFSHEQREFIRSALLNENGKCGDNNRFWINIFADHLLENLEEDLQENSSSFIQNMNFLRVATGKAILNFFDSQHILRKNISVHDRSPEQSRMLEVHPNVSNFPLSLSLDMGRILNLKKISVRTVSKDEYDMVENQHIFHVLHNQLTNANKQNTETSGSKQRIVEEEIAGVKRKSVQENDLEANQIVKAGGEWNPRSAEDTFMRLCTYKIWSEKYEQEHEWSQSKMLNEWLKEAVDLYNNVSYHWDSCHIKYFSKDQISHIRKTASNTWLADITNRAQNKTKKPSSNWILDWCTFPVFEKRQEWENYFCYVILNAKNISKLLNIHDHKPKDFEEIEESSNVESPSKKARKEGPNLEVASEENILMNIKSDITRIEEKLEKMEKNSYERHLEIFRELIGHFYPIGNQLMHLQKGQNYAQGYLDRLTSKY